MPSTLTSVSPRVTVLAVSPVPQTRAQLRTIFQHTNWDLQEAQTCQDALLALQASHASVIVCESVLPDGSWRDLAQQTALLPFRPLVVVTAPQADESLWSEVLSGGGYDVLTRPFDLREVVRIVSLAFLQSTLRNSDRPVGVRVAAGA